jgi:hypothetical protein
MAGGAIPGQRIARVVHHVGRARSWRGTEPPQVVPGDVNFAVAHPRFGVRAQPSGWGISALSPTISVGRVQTPKIWKTGASGISVASYAARAVCSATAASRRRMASNW